MKADQNYTVIVNKSTTSLNSKGEVLKVKPQINYKMWPYTMAFNKNYTQPQEQHVENISTHLMLS